MSISMTRTHSLLNACKDPRERVRRVRALGELVDVAEDLVVHLDEGVGAVLEDGDGARKLAHKGAMASLAPAFAACRLRSTTPIRMAAS